jgi:HEAT repeat protein
MLPFRWLAAAFVLLGCLAAQDDEKAVEAVKDFRRHFRSFKESSQKVEAIYTLRSSDSAAAAQELTTLLDHDEEPVRNAALEVISGYRRPETFAGLIGELPKMKNQARRSQLIAVLGRSRRAEAVPVLREIALTDKSADAAVRAEIARAFGAIGERAVADVLGPLAADKDALVRMAAADSIGVLKLSELGPTLVPLLRDGSWQVQVAAVQSAGKVRIAEAIEPLIEHLRKPGRLKEESAEALFRITTFDFGADADQWATQWKRLQALNWRPPTEEELAKALAARKKSDTFYGKKEERTTFGGITTTSVRILFIIDVSGSMEDRVIETEKFQGYENYQTLTIVKAELAKTIDGLASNVEFNIISFATALKPFKRFLVPANIVTKAEAKDWVRRLQPIGGSDAQEMAAAGLGASANLAAGKTNTFLALMSAFGMESDKDDGPTTPTGGAQLAKNKLDTVFFLSDGRPSTGKLVDTNEILKEVRKLNETFRMVFHAIAIGEFQKEFMKSLAEQNGGVFVDLGR